MEIRNTSDLITINISEFCSKIASKRVLEHYRLYNSGKSEDEIKEMIYTDEAQDMFNDFYNEYYTLIRNQ